MERVEIRGRSRAPRRAVAAVAVLGALWHLGAIPARASEDAPPADPSTEPILPLPSSDEVVPADDAETRRSHAEGLGPTITLPPLVIGTRAGGAAAVTATGGRPAQRLKQLGSVPFPMDARPKCEVLDSFGDSRSGGRAHEGIDILATLGQPIYAVSDGTLAKQYVDGVDSSLSGNGWKLVTADRSFYFYAHLSRFADGLVQGSKVRRGDLIGYVGDTGNPGAGNYHLHFEYHPQGGAAVNVLPMIDIPSTCKVY